MSGGSSIYSTGVGMILTFDGPGGNVWRPGGGFEGCGHGGALMYANDRVKIKARVKERLLHWLGLAEARHIAAGKLWYLEAHEFAKELSHVYNIPLARVVGVIAALSPSVHWSANRRQAENLCRAHADGDPLESVVVTTYGRQAAKARTFLISNKINLGKRAFKTQAFYHNILYPGGSDCVTVDQHMVAAANFTEFWVSSAHWCYNLFVDVIREIASDHGLQPHQAQAIIWLTYKDLTDSKHPTERVEDEENKELPF